MHNDPNEISEGEHLSDSLEGFDDTFVPHHNVNRLLSAGKITKIVTDTERYTFNKEAKVGTELQCPTCGKTFVKGSYQQAFCKSKQKGKASKCKDRYHNAQPHRIQRTLNWPAR